MSLNLQALADLPFKSNVKTFFAKRSAIELSITFHVFPFVILAVLWLIPTRNNSVEIAVIESPKAVPQAVNVSRAQPKVAPKAQPRAVYGVSRKAITDDTQSETVKAGNTVAKEVDAVKMKASDVDTLPVPTDEYLVQKMPVLLSEVKIPYPPEAKKNGIEGPVIMDVLIDQAGSVRDAKLISGPSEELSRAALKAVMQFKFNPAVMQDKPVAVRIRYAYRFILER